MRETQGIIERVRRVSATHQHLSVSIDESLSNLKPGQSLLARVEGGAGGYLRVQWHPVIIQKRSLLIERPNSETYSPGTVVSLLGAVGQPFKFRRTLRNVLLLAYDAEPTPLIAAIPPLMANQVSVTLLLLGRARAYDAQYLPPEVEVIRGEGDDLAWANQVMTVGWADQVFAVVAPEDETMRFYQLWTLFNDLRADLPPNYLWGVFRPPLPCGVGACCACMIRLKGNNSLYACTDGPAVDLSHVKLI